VGQGVRVYELRTYTTLPALNKRFAEHTIQLFEKHGMKSEIYWMPTDEPLKMTPLSASSRTKAGKQLTRIGRSSRPTQNGSRCATRARPMVKF
jgi:hypothetical protein